MTQPTPETPPVDPSYLDPPAPPNPPSQDQLAAEKGGTPA